MILMRLSSWFFPVVVIILSFSQGVSQERYQRVRVSLQNKSMKQLLKLDLDIDHAKPFLNRHIDLEITDQEVKRLQTEGWKVEIMVNDLAKHYSNPNKINEEKSVSLESRSVGCTPRVCNEFLGYKTPNNFSLGTMGGFYTYTEMLGILDQMVAKFPNLISKRQAIQPYKTYNGNQLHWIKISNNPNQKQDKPQILYTALHHAREPMSLTQMIFYMWYLLENYDKDPLVKNIVNSTELYFVPCINPDGYIMNNTSNPAGGGMWRKNAFKDATGAVVGVDLNRNYGFKWGNDNEGSSPNPRSETYRGPSAFSEPETQAMSSFISSQNFALALNYHSHGNYLIHPWGHTENINPHMPLFDRVSNVITDDNCFLSGTGQQTVGYKVNGDSDDWLYGDIVTKNRVFGFTPEVGSSFYPAQSEIIPIAKSAMEMNLLIPQIARNYSYATPVNPPVALNRTTNNLKFAINKVGLKNDQVKLKVTIDKGTAQSGFRESVATFNLSSGISDTVTLYFSLDQNLRDGEEVVFTYTLLFDDLEKSESLRLKYFANLAEKKGGEEFEKPLTWKTTGRWGRTDLVQNSGKFSMTDSPAALYESNTRSFATIGSPIDLTNAQKAILRYKAKWSIEEHFDYAQIQFSTDGVNYIPLCGKFTTLNNANQIVYEGFQDTWVDEEINLDHLIGRPNVWFRFEMFADQVGQFDGIYIDDFFVDVISKSSTPVIDIEASELSVYPNPASDRLFIAQGELNLDQFIIINSLGQIQMKGNFDLNTIDISQLNTGIYSLTLFNEKGLSANLKFIKQ
jgi:carboxypeptidase T